MSKLRHGVLVLAALAALLVAAVGVYGGGIDDIDSPNWGGSFLVDRTGTHRAAISATGSLSVDSTGSVTVSHVSSALHVAGIIPTREHVSGALRAWQVSACGTTASLAVASNANRRSLTIKNLGGDAANPERNVLFIGFGATGHVALTTGNGFPLSVHMVVSGAAASATAVSTTPALVLEGYEGPIACITNQNTAVMSVIEILK
mgnify:CR=1 FL=1